MAGAQNSLQRGSEWRKWDLHVHTPLSALNNQFPLLNDGSPNWEPYLTKIEALRDIAALGLTDYFSIEGYRKILEFRRDGRLQNIPLALPNIELRLGTFTGENRRVNFHVIFSDTVAADDIDNHFFGDLRFTYETAPNDGSSRWPVSRTNLEALGRRLKQEHPRFTGTDYEVGCTHATVIMDDVKGVLKEKASIFAGKYLLVVENTSTIEWDGQDHQTRKLLLQGAHAIFSSNPRDRAWARGDGGLPRDEFIREFKTLKPCLHGSDAHELARICLPQERRFCWIKADPTFEGLKQVLYEPKERIHIGDQPPSVKNDYQVLKSIQIEGPGWFEPDPIPLNRDLVAIIGGRGSGKSALAEVISFAAGSRAFRGDDVTDSFLYKASSRSSTNPVPITGAKVTLEWCDRTDSPVTIQASLKHSLSDEKVKYLPQKFVEKLCAPENNRELEREIEHVIFQRIDKTDRLDASDFTALRESATEALGLRKDQVNRTIRSLNERIFQTMQRIGLRSKKASELALRKTELTTLIAEVPQVPPDEHDSLASREALSKEKQALEAKIVGCNERLKTLDNIETKFELFVSDVQAFNQDMQNLLKVAGLEDQIGSVTFGIPAGVAGLLAGKRSELGAAVALLRDGDASDPQSVSVRSIDAQLLSLDQQSRMTATRKAQVEKYQKDRRLLEDTISALEREIKEIEDIAVPELSTDIASRDDKYCEFFQLLAKEQRVLESLYAPLRRALLNSNETARKLTFVSKITMNVPEQASRGYALVDRRKVLREENSLEAALEHYFGEIADDNFSSDSIKEQLGELAKTIPSDSGLTPADFLRAGHSPKLFDDWFYSTDAFTVSYSIKYDGKELQFLSPGEKGVVLLLLYLEAEQEDNRPLIIDQPDDNLDNLSVYPSLVDYFRNRKSTRQIIIITHNPNLVVNTDAEQIIVANFDGSRQPRITYLSGALENTDPSGRRRAIRQEVCKILEGGTEAFQRREQKYELPPT